MFTYTGVPGMIWSGYRLTNNGGMIWTNSPSFNTMSIEEPPPGVLISAASRKVHSALTFDINLPIDGNPGVECRRGGVTNDYQVIFTFLGLATFQSAAVTAGNGAVSGTSGNGSGIVTVYLTGVSNAQRITVTLQGVDGAPNGEVSVNMGVLVGDTDGDGSVNAGDALQTRSRSGQPTDATNFRFDVNADGTVNSGDTTAVRSRSGTFLP